MELRTLVRQLLRDLDEEQAEILSARERLRAEGRRLVQHDQTSDGRFELRDAVTGELLFLGNFDEGMRIWDPLWADIDTIDGDVPFVETPVEGLPETLVDALRTWVADRVDEARDYADAAKT